MKITDDFYDVNGCYIPDIHELNPSDELYDEYRNYLGTVSSVLYVCGE